MIIERHKDNHSHNTLFLFENGTQVLIQKLFWFGDTNIRTILTEKDGKEIKVEGYNLREVFTKIKHTKIRKVLNRLNGNYAHFRAAEKAMKMGQNYEMSAQRFQKYLTQNLGKIDVNYADLGEIAIPTKMAKNAVFHQKV